MARAQGVDVVGESRQLSFVDFDSDGQMDLFIAFRDRPNMLFRNDKGRFTEMASALGVADPRKTVGAVWFDMDEDGDLDLFVANQDGDANGFFRNDRTRFVDVAHDLGMDGDGRPSVYGSVGPSLADFDNNWGDYDNDGRPDLYADGYLADFDQDGALENRRVLQPPVSPRRADCERLGRNRVGPLRRPWSHGNGVGSLEDDPAGSRAAECRDMPSNVRHLTRTSGDVRSRRGRAARRAFRAAAATAPSGRGGRPRGMRYRRAGFRPFRWRYRWD